MNRSTFALFVALLIHLIFLLLFWILGSMDFKPTKPKEKKIKVSLKEMPKKDKKSGDTKKKIKQDQRIAPPMPKGKQLEKILKKPPIKYNPKQEPIVPKLNLPKPTLEPAKKKKEKKKNSLYSMLSQDKSKYEKKETKKASHSGSSIRSDLKELYGDEFGKLSQGQQKYIIDNQEIMRRITQQVLTRVARVNIPNDINENRVNIIEFYLHPNGDMTDFKFLEKSGFYVLDDTTKETIEYAYSRYPRPTEKTLIRYNVHYNLAMRR